MNPVLSILIPTLFSRVDSFNSIVFDLNSKVTELALNDFVEILYDIDNGEKTTGEKRNKLLDIARGEYCVFVDDDDEVAENYLVSILRATHQEPDAIGFCVERWFNGVRVGTAVHSSRFGKYGEYRGVWSGSPYLIRTINHITPVRTDIARQIGFKNITIGEDNDYAERLQASGLIKSEVFIDQELYRYLLVTKSGASN